METRVKKWNIIITAVVIFGFAMSCENKRSIKLNVLGVNNQSPTCINQTGYSTHRAFIRYIIESNVPNGVAIVLEESEENKLEIGYDTDSLISGRIYYSDTLIGRDTFDVFLKFDDPITLNEYNSLVRKNVRVSLKYKERGDSKVVVQEWRGLTPTKNFHFQTSPSNASDTIRSLY